MRTNQLLIGKSNTTRLTFSLLAALVILIGSLLTSSCSDVKGKTPFASITIAPVTKTAIPPSSTPVPSATVVSLSPPYSVWSDPFLPEYYKGSLSRTEQLLFANAESSSQFKISIEGTLEAGSWFYLAVAPFYSLLEDVSANDLYRCWSAGSEASLTFKHIHISPEIKQSLEYIWGPSSGDCVIPTDTLEIPQALWVETDSIAIIPFEKVEPSYKVLAVDGIDPLSLDSVWDEYPLRLHLYFQIPPGVILSQDYVPYTNYDPEKLSLVALTGVTALVRDTANIMETQGVRYPAGDIQDLLSSADITHISNEVPFAADCPPPDASQVALRFCSDDSYIQLLEAVGTDIVELSGDHFGDWGPEAMLHTIDLYENKGWSVYGGGRNLEEGLAPTYLAHNSNQFAFIGCNGKGIAIYATATDDTPGASQCDFDWMISEISRLKEAGFIVIATMQHEEVDSFWPIALQQYDFRRLAEAGADIVSGSQAHHPQGFEFLGDSFIHYGLGNLFFDQWFLSQYNPKLHKNKDKAFIDLHYFYQGQYITTRLVPLQFIDNARPRPMTPDEQSVFLERIFQSSRWNDNWISSYSSGIISTRMDE